MELTSPLTTLGSISTPESYYTARDSSNAADETTITSPGAEDDEVPQTFGYREAIQLPHELKSHCQIHLEEQLYSAAIHILNGLLSDGNSTLPTARTAAQQHYHQKQRQRQQQQKQQQPPKPAHVPPPSQLALLSTLIIHPSFTSRAPEKGLVHAASYALGYLRGLLSTVGPVNANLREAFSFDRGGGGGGKRSNAYNYTDPRGLSSGDSSDSDSVMGGQFARDQILWRRAPDFWAVLGWAFRCAAEYPARWRHWRVWLEYVVSAVEADFDERLERDKQFALSWGGGKRKTPYPMLQGGLLAGYLEDLRRERKNLTREVMRALFAFSDHDFAPDRAVFREVFDKETVAVKTTPKRKRADTVVDLDKDMYGDYLDDGDEFESEEGEDTPMPAVTRPRRKPGQRRPRAEASPTFRLTDEMAETVPFRLRLFRLLSATAYYMPETLMPVDELYETFTDHIRGLPLPMFRLFIESHTVVLPEYVRVSLLRIVVENMLAPHPDPASVDPEHDMAHGITVPVMKKCFLPFAANRVTAEDNAKLSLALESMLGFVYSLTDIEYSEGLRAAVEKGIKAREQKVKRKAAASLKGDSPEKVALDALARSSRNLRAMVEIIASTTGIRTGLVTGL